MTVVKTQGEIGPDGVLRLDLPTQLPAGPVRLTVTMEPTAPQPHNGTSYNFADLLGTVAWSGDAVREQRRLRDEW